MICTYLQIKHKIEWSSDVQCVVKFSASKFVKMCHMTEPLSRPRLVGKSDKVL